MKRISRMNRSPSHLQIRSIFVILERQIRSDHLLFRRRSPGLRSLVCIPRRSQSIQTWFLRPCCQHAGGSAPAASHRGPALCLGWELPFSQSTFWLKMVEAWVTFQGLDPLQVLKKELYIWIKSAGRRPTFRRRLHVPETRKLGWIMERLNKWYGWWTWCALWTEHNEGPDGRIPTSILTKDLPEHLLFLEVLEIVVSHVFFR